jgi:F-type H+-transporting ATPase subunit a
MHNEHGFNWLSLIPGLEHSPHHVPMAILVAMLLLVTMSIARFQLNRVTSRADGGLVPEAKLSYRNFFEIVAETLYNMVEGVIGHHHAPVYFPVIGTLFVFIFVSNLMGLIPGLLPSTDNLNTTLALGTFTFLFYNIAGIREVGIVNHIKHFMGPVLWLAPLIFVIELAGHLFRPVSLGLRLRGNIMGDHIVLGIFSNLVPYLLPVVFYGLGLFVALIQAFVFCLLTMVYISLATAHEEH